MAPSSVSQASSSGQGTQAPIVVVVMALCAGSSVRSLPGLPLKSFACLTIALLHSAVAPGAQGVVTFIVTVALCCGASDRVRSCTTPPTSVAVAGAGREKDAMLCTE